MAVTMTDTPLITVHWSELKTWQHCPQQWHYKYEERLVPKRKQLALYKGSWVHAGLESHYRDGDWRVGHNLYLNEYNKLFEEEKEELDKKGKLPLQIERILRSYLWYYRDDGWQVYAVEKEFSCPIRTKYGIIVIEGRIDLIIIDNEGKYWVVDHKTASTIPESSAFHAMDPQLLIYPFVAERLWELPVAGIIYNYVRSKAPSEPKLLKNGELSKRKIQTDYPTAYRFLKRNGYDPRDFAEVLRPLARRSPFLRRYRLPREEQVTTTIIQDSLSTAVNIANRKRIIRIITRDCVRCPYHDLCRAELNGFDTELMRKHDFEPKKEANGSSIDTLDIEDGDEEN